MAQKSSSRLLNELGKSLERDEEQRNELIDTIKGIVLFKIDDDEWTLDLRNGQGRLYKGGPEDNASPDITLTMSDGTFVALVMGKIGSQQAFLMRKLKIKGSMALALKLQPILDAAKPSSKL